MDDPTINRRDVLKRGGAAVALGMFAGAAAAAAPAGSGQGAQAAGNANVFTLLYPPGKFDFDYYRDKHLKLFRELHGTSVERIELRQVIAPPQPPGAAAPTMPFSAVVSVRIKDLAAFTASRQKHAATLARDAQSFTSLVPTVQFDTVRGVMGSTRSAPQVGERCLMFLYPNSEGAHWDVEKYRTTQMPLIMELYGSTAIRRFEVHQGERGADAGAGPAYLGLVHIYVADQAAMQAAGRKHGARLMGEHASFSNVDPLVLPSIMHGVA